MRAKKRKVVRHEEIIKKLTEEFTGGTRTLESFLSSLSHCVLLLITNLYCTLYRYTYSHYIVMFSLVKF